MKIIIAKITIIMIQRMGIFDNKFDIAFANSPSLLAEYKILVPTIVEARNPPSPIIERTSIIILNQAN